MPVPDEPKLYHIVHVDRLASILADGCVWCDAEVAARTAPGTTIGMTTIKQRRAELPLNSHPTLYVGQCVPFYFCPRSIMLYLIHKANHRELAYRGGQAPILHLEADLRRVAAWANQHGHRWAFTLSNAGSRYFEDRCELSELNQIDWDAVEARNWQQHKDGKQAEFLVERHVPWSLVDRVGVLSRSVYQQTANVVAGEVHRPQIEIRPDWYY